MLQLFLSMSEPEKEVFLARTLGDRKHGVAPDGVCCSANAPIATMAVCPHCGSRHIVKNGIRRGGRRRKALHAGY